MEPTAKEISEAVSREAVQLLEESVNKIEHCLKQLSDGQVWWQPDESQNSIGNLILHICGNLRQWTVAGIGQQRDIRDRRREFSPREKVTKDTLLQQLWETVREAKNVLSILTPAEMMERRDIQGFEVTVMGAIFHTVPHFVGHTHQVITLTRLQLGEDYQFDWSPEEWRPNVPL